MRLRLLLALVGTLAVALNNSAETTSDCIVTPHSPAFGDTTLTTFGSWPNGEVVFRPGGPGFVTNDGALGMKFGWQRGVKGKLTIEGRRLDATAAPLRSEVNNGYGDIGFQASYVIFPTPGCWEVTGRVAEASLTFVTSVVKIGDGPSWRRDR